MNVVYTSTLRYKHNVKTDKKNFKFNEPKLSAK